jgi:hypothetical protein
MFTKDTRFTDEFVKVQLRSRAPRLWGWEVCRGNGLTIESSEDLFRCAEEAWKAGQLALKQRLKDQLFGCTERSAKRLALV